MEPMKLTKILNRILNSFGSYYPTPSQEPPMEDRLLDIERALDILEEEVKKLKEKKKCKHN